MERENAYDVVICGAGLAGLTLARQLRLEQPELSVAVIDRMSRPLPEAAHKVGEASSELGAYYFWKTIGLHDYLERRHLRKLALRFFFGDGHRPFEQRPEVGPRLFPPLPTYQLDRGRLENDLRAMAADMGIDLLEGTAVDDVILANGDEPHAVHCTRSDGAQRMKVFGRWVVDALGRRRLLQSKLGLAAANGHSASSAWWRIEPRLHLEDMARAPDARWRTRVIEDRNLSTNHLMGRGYWIWLIPLSSGATSVGIVTDESIHPFHTYGKSYAQALEWLQRHEPALWRLIKDREPLDFRRLKNFSYHARQIFSHRRWSCIGEAALFLDPLYSIGSDFIAVENTITVEMIRREIRGELTEAAVEDYNRLVLDLMAPIGLAYYKDTYRTFGHAHIYTAKHAWDAAMNWSILSQLFVQQIVRNPTPEALALVQRYKELNERVQRLLIDWAEAAPPREPFAFADLSRTRWLQLLFLDLSTRRSPEQFLRMAGLNLDRLEELAQVLFWQAVEECLPQHAPKDRDRPPWIDPWRMSLAPAQWQADGLFESPSAPRSLRSMRSSVAGIFAPMTWREKLWIELPYRLRHVAGGKPGTAVIRFLHRRLFRDKPALRARRLFIVDRPAVPRAAGR